MKFNLVDRITELEPRRRIRTIKSLTQSEEYLADHFPTFPVMPGVLMLECMIQSATWLVHASAGFSHSLVTLSQAKNVTFKSFVSPGRVLEMEVEAKLIEESNSEFIGRGRCDGIEVVKARITLQHQNLADTDECKATIDHQLISDAQRQFAIIGGESILLALAP